MKVELCFTCKSSFDDSGTINLVYKTCISVYGNTHKWRHTNSGKGVYTFVIPGIKLKVKQPFLYEGGGGLCESEPVSDHPYQNASKTHAKC